MYTELANYGYYKVTTDSPEKYHELIRELEDKLPHGSGINGNWHVKAYQYKNRIYLQAFNIYEAMNENGFYCHRYVIHPKFIYNPELTKVCEYCKGMKYRTYEEIAEKTGESWEHVKSRLLDDLRFIEYDDRTFVCNLCSGTGRTKIQKFELLPDRIVYGRELNCCGYDLDNYLGELFACLD